MLYRSCSAFAHYRPPHRLQRREEHAGRPLRRRLCRSVSKFCVGPRKEENEENAREICIDASGITVSYGGVSQPGAREHGAATQKMLRLGKYIHSKRTFFRPRSSHSCNPCARPAAQRRNTAIQGGVYVPMEDVCRRAGVALSIVIGRQG
jgi:hypothetical protein